MNKKICKYCNIMKDNFKTKFYIKINKETKIKSRNKLFVKSMLTSCYNSDKRNMNEDFINRY